ncbi:MAG: DUF378 domain-containing protein [Clostridia bacterium]|nr:DUF378 domain-containing protein [Clostridia bacterium]
MISLICFILTLAGSINWFCIGVLQYDFVAGLFGSQANVFSRIIYALIGISSIWLVYAIIKGKGSLKIDGKKQSDQEILSTRRSHAAAETSKSYHYENNFNGFGNQLDNQHYEPRHMRDNHNDYNQNSSNPSYTNNSRHNDF